MNEVDKRILALLQENADMPITEISKKVNLSPTPCWARINKLQKQGFITGKVAVLDRRKINLGVVAWVQVKTDQHNDEWLRKFDKVVKEMPEVTEFYRLSGSYDYIMKVLVPSIDKYDDFYKRLTSQIQITNYITSFSLEEIKYTNVLPLNYV